MHVTDLSRRNFKLEIIYTVNKTRNTTVCLLTNNFAFGQKCSVLVVFKYIVFINHITSQILHKKRQVAYKFRDAGKLLENF